MTSGTERVSCSGRWCPCGLSRGCADSGDFRARHYVRIALLALPGVGAQDRDCVGPRGSPATLGDQHLNPSWEGVLGRGCAAASASQVVEGAGLGRGPRLRSGDLGRDRCQDRGARARKVRSTGAGAGGRVRTGRGGGSHAVTSSLVSSGRSSKEPSLMARNTPPSL